MIQYAAALRFKLRGRSVLDTRFRGMTTEGVVRTQ
jgi:hypothetical protein